MPKPRVILAALALMAVSAAGSVAAQQNEHRLTVINGAADAIEYLYFAACGAGEWGKDRLGSKEIIKPGERRLFSIKGGSDACCHDLRVKLQSGASRQKLNMDICRESEWTVR